MKTIRNLILTFLFSLMSVESYSCHALAVQNFNLTVTGTGVEVDAESTNPTCGCGDYWLDVEIRCLGEVFDAGPFDPTQYLFLSTYPYFQSATMLKPNCVVQAYPTTTIPFGSLCPGVDYQVRVRENNNGTGGPWSAALNFTAPGVIDPLVVDISADEDTICDGECAVLTSTVSGGCNLALDYLWSNDSTNSQINVCPTTTTSYTVTVTEICSDTTTAENITVEVVGGLDVGLAQIEDDTICENEEVEIALINYDGDIEWEMSTNGGPFININLTNDTINSGPLTEETCYRALVSGCDDTDISNFVCVSISPDPGLTVDDHIICEGDDVTINSDVVIVGGNYQWDNGSNISSITVSPTQNTTYEVIYELNGCEVTAESEVLVNELPNVSFTVDDICLNESVTFNNSTTLNSPNGDFIDGYMWNFDDGNTSTDTDPTNTYTSSGNYDVILVAETDFGCVSSSTNTLQVFDLPVVDFEVDDNCFGVDSEFNSLVNNFSTWGFGDGNISNLNNPNHIYSNSGTYDVTLTQEDPNGCVNDTTQEVTIFPLPTANFTGQDLSSCSPLCFNIQSNSVSGDNIDQYIWTFSNGNTYNGQSISDCIENETSNDIILGVTLEVITENGCNDVVTENNYLEIYRKPFSNFEYTSDNPNILNSTIDFNNLSLNSDYYTWNISENGSYSTEDIQIEFGDEPGEYDIELISYTDHCSDTSNGVIVIDDIILFYVPNTFTPNSNGINDVFKPILKSGFDPFNYNLTIYNRWGEILFESNDAEIGWDGTYNNKIVRDGTYVWKISFKESMSDKKHTYIGHINVIR